MEFLSNIELYTLNNLYLQGDMAHVKSYLAKYPLETIHNTLIKSIRSDDKLGLIDYKNLLLTDNLDINKPGPGGDTAMYAATLKNNLWMVKDLISKKADVNALCVNGTYPVLAACSTPEKIELLEFLLKSGANPNLVTNSGHTSFIYCVKGDSPQSITKMIEAGANMNFRDNDNYTPLQSALFLNKTDNVIALCHGAKDTTQINEFKKQINEVSKYPMFDFANSVINSIEVKMNLDTTLDKINIKSKKTKI